MKKNKKRTDLLVRELTIADAHGYYQIAKGDFLNKFANFFSAGSIDEAKQRIIQMSSYYEKLYGLFSNNRLAAVFDVSQDTQENGETDGAIIHCFVGEKYHGRGYAAYGIKTLTNFFPEYSYFIFEVNKNNSTCLNMLHKLQLVEFFKSNKNTVYRYFKYCF